MQNEYPNNQPIYPTAAQFRKELEEIYTVFDTPPDLEKLAQEANLSPSEALQLADIFAGPMEVALRCRDITKDVISIVDDLEVQEKKVATMQAQLNEWIL